MHAYDMTLTQWHMCVWSKVMRHKASNKLPSGVIVLAFSGPRSASLNNAVGAAAKANITVITSAGEGPNCGPGLVFGVCAALSRVNSVDFACSLQARELPGVPASLHSCSDMRSMASCSGCSNSVCQWRWVLRDHAFTLVQTLLHIKTSNVTGYCREQLWWGQLCHVTRQCSCRDQRGRQHQG